MFAYLFLQALQKANDILSEIRDIGMDEFF